MLLRAQTIRTDRAAQITPEEALPWRTCYDPAYVDVGLNYTGRFMRVFRETGEARVIDPRVR